MILAILRVEEAADRLKISRQAVMRAVREGKRGLQGVRVGRITYILADSLADYRPNRYPTGSRKAQNVAYPPSGLGNI